MAVKAKKRSKPIKPDLNELYSELKDQFVDFTSAAKYDADDLNKAPTPNVNVPTPKALSSTGQLAAEFAQLEKPQTDGPFTKENIVELNKYVCKKLLNDKFGHTKPTDETVAFYNRVVRYRGYFKDIEEWWGDSDYGFWTCFWGNNSYESFEATLKQFPKQEHRFITWFEAYQHFIKDQNIPGVEAPKPKVPRQTQKAKGIERLLSFAGRFSSTTLPHLFLSNEEVKKLASGDKLDWFWDQISAYQQNKQIFARCCPMNPRHGFTDSIFIDARDEDTFRFQIGSLCKKMLADDENGELIIMRPCFATWNAVVNDKSIVLGRNHDGATGGKNTFTFPIAKPFLFSQSEKDQIGIDSNHSVFSEFVGVLSKERKHDNGAGSSGGFQIESRFLTQLRGGPKIDITGDFVPRKVVLDRDFLIPHCKEDGSEYRDTEWEKLIEDVKKRSDWDKYFVLHRGGSISSHFGVHCFINEIPYIVSDVKLGKKETLEPNATKRMAWNAEAFRVGFEKAPELLKLIKDVNAVNILLAALHNFPALDLSDPKQAEFFGFSCGFAVYLSIATCLGEFRYGKRLARDKIVVSHKELTREEVYSRVLVSDFNYSLRKAFRKCRLFGVPSWGSSVGGLKWLECSEAAFDLWNACCEFVAKGTKENLNLVASKLNKTVNVCHNNAKMLTKFGGDFDLGERYPQQVAFKVAPIVFELLNSDVIKTRINFTQVELDPQVWNTSEVLKRRSYRRSSSGKAVLTEDEKPSCHNYKGKNGELCGYAECIGCYCQAIKGGKPQCSWEKAGKPCPFSHNIPQAASEEPDNASDEDENENECECGEHDCSKCTPDGYVDECTCYTCYHDSSLTPAGKCTKGDDCEEEHCCCDSCSN